MLAIVRRLRHTSHVTRHTSHITHHTSHITHHTSHITHHTSHITHHTSHLTPHTHRMLPSKPGSIQMPQRWLRELLHASLDSTRAHNADAADYRVQCLQVSHSLTLLIFVAATSRKLQLMQRCLTSTWRGRAEGARIWARSFGCTGRGSLRLAIGGVWLNCACCSVVLFSVVIQRAAVFFVLILPCLQVPNVLDRVRCASRQMRAKK